jgi:F0F1-type ATP synthase assembly protein I
MFVAWAILSPIAKHKGWAPGPTGSMENGARGWVLWVALSIMTIDSITSILPIAGEFLSMIGTQLRYTASLNTSVNRPSPIQDRRSKKDDDEVEPLSRLIPTRWVLTGLIASVVFGTVVVWMVFGYEGIKPWATLLGFLMGGAMSLLGYVTCIVYVGHSCG